MTTTIKTYSSVSDAMNAISHDVDWIDDDMPVYEITLMDIVNLCEASGRSVQKRFAKYAEDHENIKIRMTSDLKPWVCIDGKWIRDGEKGLESYGAIGWLLRRLAELVPPRHDDYRGDYMVCVGSSHEALTTSHCFDRPAEYTDSLEDAEKRCEWHRAYGDTCAIMRYNNETCKYENLDMTM